MKLVIAGVILGALVGGWTSNHYHKAQVASLKTQAIEAEVLRVKAVSQLSKEYYGLFKELNDKPPTVVTDRVLVKASCPPVRTSGTPGVGEGEALERVELDPQTVRRATGVTDWGDKKFEQCSIQLNALLDMVEAVGVK